MVLFPRLFYTRVLSPPTSIFPFISFSFIAITPAPLSATVAKQAMQNDSTASYSAVSTETLLRLYFSTWNAWHLAEGCQLSHRIYVSKKHKQKANDSGRKEAVHNGWFGPHRSTRKELREQRQFASRSGVTWRASTWCAVTFSQIWCLRC